MKNYISGVENLEEHRINLDDLMNWVQDLKRNYWLKYHKEPKYIKMPVWLFIALRGNQRQLIGFNDDKIATYMGFIVCETYSIDQIYQIELF